MPGLAEPATPNEAPGDGKIFAHVCMHMLGSMVGEAVDQELVELTSNASGLGAWMHLDVHVPRVGVRNVDQPVEPEMADHPPFGLGDVRLGRGEGRLPPDGGAKIFHASWQPVWIDAVSDRDDLGVVSVSGGADGDHAFGLVVRSPGRF